MLLDSNAFPLSDGKKRSWWLVVRIHKPVHNDHCMGDDVFTAV